MSTLFFTLCVIFILAMIYNAKNWASCFKTEEKKPEIREIRNEKIKRETKEKKTFLLEVEVKGEGESFTLGDNLKMFHAECGGGSVFCYVHKYPGNLIDIIDSAGEFRFECRRCGEKVVFIRGEKEVEEIKKAVVKTALDGEERNSNGIKITRRRRRELKALKEEDVVFSGTENDLVAYLSILYLPKKEGEKEKIISFLKETEYFDEEDVGKNVERKDCEIKECGKKVLINVRYANSFRKCFREEFENVKRDKEYIIEQLDSILYSLDN